MNFTIFLHIFYTKFFSNETYLHLRIIVENLPRMLQDHYFYLLFRHYFYLLRKSAKKNEKIIHISFYVLLRTSKLRCILKNVFKETKESFKGKKEAVKEKKRIIQRNVIKSRKILFGKTTRFDFKQNSVRKRKKNRQNDMRYDLICN